jgi:hypothetical protein
VSHTKIPARSHTRFFADHLSISDTLSVRHPFVSNAAHPPSMFGNFPAESPSNASRAN